MNRPSTKVAKREETDSAACAIALDEMRRFGHLFADLDPLSGKANDPWAATAQQRTRQIGEWSSQLGNDSAELVDRYCGTLAIEADHLRDKDRRQWLHGHVEKGDLAPFPDRSSEAAWQSMLLSIDAFELYMQGHFPGEKTLSIEGLDATVLMIEDLVQLAANDGINKVAIGMAHRGRLAILTHVCGLPFEHVLRELESTRGNSTPTLRGISSDVLQHIGHETVREIGPNRIAVHLVPNPSHLEFVTPVALGVARAAVDAGGSALPILIHGDAAHCGQGVLAETFNLSGIGNFTSGGAIHLIQDNRLGFTTEAQQGRSTRWPSDMVRGYEVPVLHVNSDDVMACLHASRIAYAYRATFGGEIVLHALGYRRHGHTEADEPRFTQPELYRAIDEHTRVVDIYSKSLAEKGSVSETETQAEKDRISLELAKANEEARHPLAEEEVILPVAAIDDKSTHITTGVGKDRLVGIARKVGAIPASVQPHPKITQVIERRLSAIEDKGIVDWTHAELLAFASCVEDGRVVRISGQDVTRGTFSQRHVGVRDMNTDEWYWLLTPLDPDQRLMKVVNSPLSEASVLGFEYGYGLGNTTALTIWEAQFGDFANGAQVIIDQFVASGQAKWGTTSRLVMLLPHGYEGAGPEHSSARLERYLQLGADNNLAIISPTTAAQYFHALRWQAVRERPCPLVVMTPKSLLRAQSLASAVDEFGEDNHFKTAFVSYAADNPRHLVFATGKFAVEIDTAARKRNADLAVCRIEQLFPFPTDTVAEVLARFPDCEVVWSQEEPENMGALYFVERELRRVTSDRPIKTISRPPRAAVAEGHLPDHQAMQAELLARTLATEG